MATKRATIVQSLWERGVPEMWATTEETAALSGMTLNTFCKWRKSREARGFPSPDPATGKWFIPAVVAFWQKRSQPSLVVENRDVDEQEKENW